MPRLLPLVALAALLAVQAQAGPAKPQPGAATRTRQSAMAGFDARMNRLDALMGAPSATRTGRARSAEAGR